MEVRDDGDSGLAEWFAEKVKETKVQGFNVQLKADKISLVYHTKKTKIMKREKRKK